MNWLEVCVEAGERGTDALCALLEALGVSGLVVEDENGERLTLRSGEVFQIRPVKD